jgi:hypothetical protein
MNFFIIEQETLASFLNKEADFFSNTEKDLNGTSKSECSISTKPQRRERGQGTRVLRSPKFRFATA